MTGEKQTIVFEKSLMEPIDGYDSKRLVKFQRALGKRKADVTERKETKYNGSWQSDGIMGAFFNLKRKTDRINHMFKSGQLGSIDNGEEQVYDTLMDLSNYSDFLLFYFYEKDPNFRESVNQRFPDLAKEMEDGE